VLKTPPHSVILTFVVRPSMNEHNFRGNETFHYILEKLNQVENSRKFHFSKNQSFGKKIFKKTSFEVEIIFRVNDFWVLIMIQ